MSKLVKIIVLLSLVFIYSCADKKEVTTAELDYIKAHKKLQERDYASAAEDFKKIGDEYPLSRWGAKAQTMATYAYYKEEKLDDVIATADEFIKSNPASSYVPYMQYMKSISYYDQINDIHRAQDNARAASYSFRELIARFPDSEYVSDSKEKLILVDEHIAGAKMSVGRYQLTSGNYVGAIKNFQDVLHGYSRTNQAPEAYFRLFEAHQKIGITEAADAYRTDLNLIYPDNDWDK